ncbi:MAG TPA: DUF58 domain-containing protein [Acidimicrobiales bacterium]|nr:DUF58 domain-containing protein [Acidimicrobiales bacterium]
MPGSPTGSPTGWAPTVEQGRAHLSQRGWYAVGTLLTMLAIAVLIGIQELYALAGAGFVAGAISWLTMLGRRDLQVTMGLGEPLVPRGQELIAHVAACNSGVAHACLVTVTLPVKAVGGDWSVFSFRSAALVPGQIAGAQMKVPTQRRGLVALGPVSLTTGDRLGFFERTWSSRQESFVTVHPVPRRLSPTPLPASGAVWAEHRSTPDRSAPAPWSEELELLRNFRDGDDLRLVHWPTSARRGRLVVREPVPLAGSRSVLLVDCRVSAHESTLSPEESLEAVLEIAAGLIFPRTGVISPLTGRAATGPAAGHAITAPALGHTWALATTAGGPAGNDRRLALRLLALAQLHQGPAVLDLDLLAGAQIVVVSSSPAASAQLTRAVEQRSPGASVMDLSAWAPRRYKP